MNSFKTNWQTPVCLKSTPKNLTSTNKISQPTWYMRNNWHYKRKKPIKNRTQGSTGVPPDTHGQTSRSTASASCRLPRWGEQGGRTPKRDANTQQHGISMPPATCSSAKNTSGKPEGDSGGSEGRDPVDITMAT